MMNLLPPQEKRELALQQNKKLAMVLGGVVLIFLVSLSMALFSVKFYLLGEVTYQKNILGTTEKKYETPDFLASKSLIQSYNASLVKMNEFYQHDILASGALKTLLAVERPAGLSLTNIFAQKNLAEAGKKNTVVKVSFSGISEARDDLMLYKTSLESNPDIKNIYFPPNNWIKPSELSFYITFEYDNQN